MTHILKSLLIVSLISIGIALTGSSDSFGPRSDMDKQATTPNIPFDTFSNRSIQERLVDSNAHLVPSAASGMECNFEPQF